jgi:hypothetical protein
LLVVRSIVTAALADVVVVPKTSPDAAAPIRKDFLLISFTFLTCDEGFEEGDQLSTLLEAKMSISM